MPESIRPEKNQLTFNQGLNTESSEIAFPDGFTTDERNYELLLDGSRRRRKGLAQESGGSDKDLGQACVGANQTYVWKNVAGDPDKTFIVHKFGSVLHFTNDAETISTSYHAEAIELDTFEVTTSSVSMDDQYAQFTSGRGYLIVTGGGIKPTVISYDPDTDCFLSQTVNIQIRDYSDQEDGFLNTQFPTALSDETRYNLLNRGWTDTNITLYYTDAGSTQYPNKSVAMTKAFARLLTGSSSFDEDGIKSFSHAKYTAEPATASSAALGSLIINPLDSGYANSSGVPVVNVTAMDIDDPDETGTWIATLTVDVDPSIAVGAQFQLNDTASHYNATILGFSFSAFRNYDGIYTATTGTTGTTVKCQFSTINGWVSWVDEDYAMGTVGSGSVIVRPSGSALNVGPRACAFHDGRVFYAGINDNEWSDYVFFSQVPDKINKFGKCYQVADPTDEQKNELVDTDGGWFAIQGVQGVKRMLSVRGALLIFAENGVWEVGGGQRGFFTPGGYSIRKITDAGCNSPLSPIAVQNTAFYTGPEGVFRIAPNQYTGILEATSVSKELIQTKWNAITEQEQRRVMSVYDDSKQLINFLYGKAAASGYYDEILILDVEIPAWYYYSYIRTSPVANTGILSAYAISYTDSTEQANKIKFSCNVTDADTVRTCDHSQTAYLDFDGAESPLPYAVTGWDNLGDFQRRRQAPIVTVYSKRTETGYTDGGAGWSGDNESSTKMTAFWDWTEAKQYTSTARTAQEDWDGTGDTTKPSISGKIDNQQQVYRHTRAFTPANATDVDGYPVVVTRNKVRGRGRVLQLRFDGEATKDSHIMGFTTNYRAQRSY